MKIMLPAWDGPSGKHAEAQATVASLVRDQEKWQVCFAGVKRHRTNRYQSRSPAGGLKSSARATWPTLNTCWPAKYCNLFIVKCQKACAVRVWALSWRMPRWNGLGNRD